MASQVFPLDEALHSRVLTEGQHWRGPSDVDFESPTDFPSVLHSVEWMRKMEITSLSLLRLVKTIDIWEG